MKQLAVGMEPRRRGGPVKKKHPAYRQQKIDGICLSGFLSVGPAVEGGTCVSEGPMAFHHICRYRKVSAAASKAMTSDCFVMNAFKPGRPAGDRLKQHGN